MQSSLINARLTTLSIVESVITDGKTLDAAWLRLVDDEQPHQPQIKAWSYGVIRWYHQLRYLLSQFVDKPIKQHDLSLELLLLLGLYQLRHSSAPAQRVVNETVETAVAIQRPWAKRLVNAVLRNYLRQAGTLSITAEAANYSYPKWMLKYYQKTWPDMWPQLLMAGNQSPPFSLRVNVQRGSTEAYLERLQLPTAEVTTHPALPQALTLTNPVSVDRLPGFFDGDVSVQDVSAQYAAQLLDLQPGQRVLDACAAPGGKAAHCIEQVPDIHLLALDRDSERVTRLQQTFSRLGLQATIRCADANEPEQWWDGQLFDRILLDAPCAGLGVIRRHPDIKLLRRRSDLQGFADSQTRLLERLWPLLAPGGLLLYATCSISVEENHQNIAAFLQQHEGVEVQAVTIDASYTTPFGSYIFPNETHDGFFYAKLKKSATHTPD